MRTIEHWIDGADHRRRRHPARRRSGTRPPASSRPRSCWPSRPTWTPRWPPPRPRSTEWSQASLTRRTQGAVRLPRAGQRAHRRARRDHLRRARQGALRRARARCSAAWRWSSSPAGCRTLLKGDYSDQVSTGVDVFSFREPLGVVRRDHARSTSRPWCRCGCTRSRSPAATRSCSSRASATRRRPQLVARLWQEAGLPDGVFNVVHGDKVAVDAMLDHPGVAAVSFVGSTPIARYIHEKAHRDRQAGAGPRRREEPRDRAARRRPRLRLRPPGRRRRSARRGSGAWRSRPRSRSAPAADALVDVVSEKARKVTVGAGRDAASEMGPVVTAAARDRIVGPDRRRRAPGRHGSPVDGRGLVVPGYEDGLLRRPDRASTRSPPRWTSTARRSSARCCRCCGPTRSTRRSRWSTPTRTATAPRSSPTPARRPAGSSTRRARRHGRDQRADPGADGLLLLRRLEGLAVRRQARPRPRGRLLLHPGKVITSRWPHVEHASGASYHFPTAT